MKDRRALCLYYVTTGGGFERDFVLARSTRGARAVMRGMYGDPFVETVDLVCEVPSPPPTWATEPSWLGPQVDELGELGGERVRGGQWRFGDRVFGDPGEPDS